MLAAVAGKLRQTDARIARRHRRRQSRPVDVFQTRPVIGARRRIAGAADRQIASEPGRSGLTVADEADAALSARGPIPTRTRRTRRRRQLARRTRVPGRALTGKYCAVVNPETGAAVAAGRT